MLALVASYHTALPDAAAGAPPPEWLHVLPRGTFRGADGRGPYTVDPDAVIAATPLPLPLDENHSTHFAQSTGQQSPARAWLRELQAREDGVWARADWSPSGAALMAERAYRGISPVFRYNAKSGAVSAILHAALTNTPNLQLTALHSREHDMDLLASLRVAMGLAETVDEAGVLAAVTAQAAAVAAHATQMAAIAAKVGLKAEAGAEGILTALQSQQGKDALGEVVALQTQVNELRQARSRDLATAAIGAAIAAGKPIPASRRDDFIARHMADPAGTDAWLADMPAINAGGVSGRPPNPAPSDGGIDAGEAQAIALTGVDPEKFKAAKAAFGGRA